MNPVFLRYFPLARINVLLLIPVIASTCLYSFWNWGYTIVFPVNNNQLVFDNFDEVVVLNPDAHPLLHSDRGFQYTSITFYNKHQAAKRPQSMFRVDRCIDHGPIESFLGMLKSEIHYLRRFNDRDELILAIENYIHFTTQADFRNGFTA